MDELAHQAERQGKMTEAKLIEIVNAAVPPGVCWFPIDSVEEWLKRREPDFTASNAGVLFHDGPVEMGAYSTPLKMWALKSKIIEAEKGNRAMRRGQLIEPVILQMLREEYPTWTFVQASRYYRDPASRIGASPDFFAFDPERPEGFGALDGKSIGKYAGRKKWQDADGDRAVPLWIAVQVNVTAALCGASWGAVAAYHMDSDWIEPVEEVPLRPGVMAALTPRVQDFWRRVEQNDPYDPDFNRDADLIGDLYDGENGPVIELGDAPDVAALLDEREALKAREADGAAAAKARKPVDAQLIHRLGNASAARIADGRTFGVKIIRRKGFTVAPSEYPQLSVKEQFAASAKAMRAAKPAAVPLSYSGPF